MGDYTGCVGDAVTGQRLCVPFIVSKTEYRSCRGGHWRRLWQLIWRIVRCCCHTLRSWHHRHRHFHWQRLPSRRRYLTFSCTFRATYYKGSSRIFHPQWSCRYRFTNRTRVFFWPLGTVADIGFAVDVVETRWFQTPLATVVEFTRIQRAYKQLWTGALSMQWVVAV